MLNFHKTGHHSRGVSIGAAREAGKGDQPAKPTPQKIYRITDKLENHRSPLISNNKGKAAHSQPLKYHENSLISLNADENVEGGFLFLVDDLFFVGG